ALFRQRDWNWLASRTPPARIRFSVEPTPRTLAKPNGRALQANARSRPRNSLYQPSCNAFAFARARSLLKQFVTLKRSTWRKAANWIHSFWSLKDPFPTKISSGYCAAQGTDPQTGQPILTVEWIDRLAPKA